ncbi:FAD-dependent oxidoreductase [Fictibacillus enclensis]|nr:FAD-dependent oxidoreductase [Fictibacillus enclensis]MDM5339154.1 FAD-dependent oxidoreductase [Fictibacillus enclensis]
MEESRVTLYFHSMFLRPLMEDNKVNGIIIANKSGIQAIRAKITIDCSADGDFVNGAGVEMKTGRKQDGLTQPMTMFFRVAGVNDEAVQNYVKADAEEKHLFSSIIEVQRKNGNWTLNRDKVGIYREPEKGVWRVNTSRIQGLNGTDVKDLTKAEIEGRKQVFNLMDFFHKYLPGFENATLLDTGVQIGIRETRRIVGIYTLTAEDLTTGRDFEDTIALYGYPIDIHSPTDGSTDFNNSAQTANIYRLPYRILIPEKVDGLMVAGRCVSATHEALGAIRVMPCAFALGHAAGVGASVALKEKSQPRNVKISVIQKVLEEQNAVLPKHIASLNRQ